jgi:hypothetical protein
LGTSKELCTPIDIYYVKNMIFNYPSLGSYSDLANEKNIQNIRLVRVSFTIFMMEILNKILLKILRFTKESHVIQVLCDPEDE